ncbi:hypothetical protein GNE10_25895, partial [Nostoc sp. 2RC]|nr:hypothetical protein [Nostoc sp. 2RC]
MGIGHWALVLSVVVGAASRREVLGIGQAGSVGGVGGVGGVGSINFLSPHTPLSPHT